VLRNWLFTWFFLIAFCESAWSTTINFDSATTTSGCHTDLGGGSIDGFTLTSGGINNKTACAAVVNATPSGNNYMLNNSSGAGEFTKDEGTFSLKSLWVHSDRRVGTTTVKFQGLDGDGNILISMDVVLSYQYGLLVVFTDWLNLKTFTWDPISPNVSNVAIDDFTYEVSAAPLPAALPLFGCGVGLMSLFGWWRRVRRA
jgi:hypothetical protein